LHAAFEIKVKPHQAAFCSTPQHRFLGLDLKTLVSVYSFVKELMKKRFQSFQTPKSASNTVSKLEVNILTTGMLQLGAVFRFRRSQQNRSPTIASISTTEAPSKGELDRYSSAIQLYFLKLFKRAF
jgi:hypothetical protein